MFIYFYIIAFIACLGNIYIAIFISAIFISIVYLVKILPVFFVRLFLLNNKSRHLIKSDIEIAQSVELKPIADISKQININSHDLELYGKYKAKLSFEKIKAVQSNPLGKLILVTSINPTPAGEGNQPYR